MTRFKKLVEDQIQQVMQQPKPTVLTDEIKAQVLEAINKTEVDVTELPSYHNYGHPDQNFARFPEPDDIEWDEEEEFQAKVTQFVENMNADGIVEMIDIPQEKWNDVNYLQRLQTEIEVWLATV